MKLFRWSSEVLAGYGSGHIIVMAENLEEARDKALVKFEEFARNSDNFGWIFWNGEFFNEDSQVEWAAKKEEFRKDIWKESLDNSDTIFIMGSS